MNQQHIRILLEKYFEGETNLQEEAQLAQYFQQENIAEDLVQYKPLFQFYDQQKNITLSEEFDQKIQQEITPKKRSRIVRMYGVLARVAAVIALSFLTYQAYEYYISPEQKNPNYIVLNEAEDAEEAYEQIKAALMLVSSKMNEGTEKTTSGLIKINQATEIVRQKD